MGRDRDRDSHATRQNASKNCSVVAFEVGGIFLGRSCTGRWFSRGKLPVKVSTRELTLDASGHARRTTAESQK